MDINAKHEKFSYSKLEKYESCPFAYRLKYVEKHFIDTCSIATEFGTLVHFIEETIANDIKANNNEPIFMINMDKYIDLFYNIKDDKEKIYGWNILVTKYDDSILKEKDKYGISYYDKKDIYVKEGIYRLCNNLDARRDLNVVATEQPFTWEYRGYVFNGFIDRILKNVETNQIYIEDIKTWTKFKDDYKTTPLQFVIYCLAASTIFGIPAEAFVCRYDLPIAGEIVEVGTKGFIKRGLKKLDKLIDSIEAKDFAPNPSALCYWCEYSATNPNQKEEAKNLCPYFCHYTKENNKDFSVEWPWQEEKNHQEILEQFIASNNKKLTITTNNNVVYELNPFNEPSVRRVALRR